MMKKFWFAIKIVLGFGAISLAIIFYKRYRDTPPLLFMWGTMVIASAIDPPKKEK